MNCESHELGPFTPVSDFLVLAAIQRAQRHNGKRPAIRPWISAHLGFVHDAKTGRGLRPHLTSLLAAGSVERSCLHGGENWALTPAGTRRLAAARRAGKVEKLPESPQHREWRHAREDAEARYDDFRTIAYETLEAAETAMGSASGPDSKALFELSERLQAAFWLLGSATYCRAEWPEPDDSRMDREPSHHPVRGLNRTSEWKTKEKRAKGGTR